MKIDLRKSSKLEPSLNKIYNEISKSKVYLFNQLLEKTIKQIDKKENWRRIIDLKNNSGWIHRSQLKPINSVIPLKDKILFKKPSLFSKPIAQIKKGRILVIRKCLFCNEF